jgi:hypothetical protein
MPAPNRRRARNSFQPFRNARQLSFNDVFDKYCRDQAWPA